MGEKICKQCDLQGVSIQNIQTANTTQYKKKKKQLEVYKVCVWMCVCLLNLIHGIWSNC